MSVKCAVCSKILDETEIRLNKRGLGRNKRYLCKKCRKKEYDNYTKSIHDLINKK